MAGLQSVTCQRAKLGNEGQLKFNLIMIPDMKIKQRSIYVDSSLQAARVLNTPNVASY